METGGAIEGSTLELVRLAGREERSALLTGARLGLHVSFTKVYGAASQFGLAPVVYTGLADAELAVVQGDWRLASREPLHGGFLMRRISTHRVFALRGTEEPARRRWLSWKELRARQEAIRQRRIWIFKPRKPRRGPKA